MKVSINEQMKIITNGIELIYSEDELRAKLVNSEKTGKPLTVKLGLDPSAPDIHIGHAVVLRKMHQMQELGHKIVIIIGDFTGRIGDPSGKSKGRNALSNEQVLSNARTYTDQIFKILDRDKTEVRFNSEWLSKLNFEDVIRLASTTTVARILERDDFTNRYRSNTPIGLHEFFYPLMQAYDSVAINADIELGGTDQTFNILMGRNLMKAFGLEQQIAMFVPILEGLDGVEKMSKSLGNYIGVDEPANIMFKKVMEVPDSLIIRYFRLTTDMHPDRISEIEEELKSGRNPKDIKLELAHTITSLYHSAEDTQKAREFYDVAFSKKAIPEDIPDLVIDDQADKLIDVIPLLVKAGFAPSGSEFRRMFTQGGIQINGEKADDLGAVLASGDVLKIGKKKFVKIIK